MTGAIYDSRFPEVVKTFTSALTDTRAELTLYFETSKKLTLYFETSQ